MHVFPIFLTVSIPLHLESSPVLKMLKTNIFMKIYLATFVYCSYDSFSYTFRTRLLQKTLWKLILLQILRIQTMFTPILAVTVNLENGIKIKLTD